MAFSRRFCVRSQCHGRTGSWGPAPSGGLRGRPGVLRSAPGAQLPAEATEIVPRSSDTANTSASSIRPGRGRRDGACPSAIVFKAVGERQMHAELQDAVGFHNHSAVVARRGRIEETQEQRLNLAVKGHPALDEDRRSPGSG